MGTKYIVDGNSLTSVADEIRAKGGTTADLEFPTEFITAIRNISSGGTPRTSADLTVSGATVTAPAGTYASNASKSVSTMTLPTSAASSATSGYSLTATLDRSTSDRYINIAPGYNSAGGYYKISKVANGSATTPATTITVTPTVSLNSETGIVTGSVSGSQSITPTVSAGYVSSGTAGTVNVSGSAWLQMTTQAAQTIHPSQTDQSISAYQYLTGAQTIKAVTLSNITADNIKSGIVVKVGDSTDDDCVTSVTGTYAGSGGVGTLLATLSMGTISTSSTNAADTGKSISVSGVNDYDLLIVETSVNSVTNNRHTATVGLIFLTASSTVGTKNGASVATVKWNSRVSSNGTTTTRAGTTAYGIYPNSCSVSTSNSVTTATIPMYQRYNSTSTGTINGSYTARVYGMNLYDLIGG